MAGAVKLKGGGGGGDGEGGTGGYWGRTVNRQACWAGAGDSASKSSSQSLLSFLRPEKVKCSEGIQLV